VVIIILRGRGHESGRERKREEETAHVTKYNVSSLFSGRGLRGDCRRDGEEREGRGKSRNAGGLRARRRGKKKKKKEFRFT